MSDQRNELLNWAKGEEATKKGKSGENETKVTYKVTAYTGSMEFAGTDETISIAIAGNRDSFTGTKFHTLDKELANDFEKGDTDEYTFEDIDVGLIEFVVVKVGKGLRLNGDPDFYLEKLRVSVGTQDVGFPFHQWITSNSEVPLILLANETRLPQKDSKVRQWAREIQLEAIKDLVEWSHDLNMGPGKPLEDVSKGLPGFLLHKDIKYETLDKKFQYYQENRDEYAELKKMLKNFVVGSAIKNVFDPISDVEEYKEVVNLFDNGEDADNHGESVWLKEWDSDFEFGRQTLNGMNPSCIHRIREIPKKFPVTNEQVKGLLSRNLTLEEEAEAGNIYLVDYKILEGISTGWEEGVKDGGERLSMAAAMAMFYHEPENDDLRVIAIQLGQHPGPECPVWTAKDKRDDWLLAKFWFRNADAQIGQLVTHLCYSHFMIEPFAVGVHRCLPATHPLHKMLKEHIRFIIAVDTRGRELLISPGGAGDVSLTTGFGSTGILELLIKTYKSFTYDHMDYKEDLKRRDMMDLPKYWHRDDAVMLWEATLNYVREMVDAFYISDDDVLKDWELQTWVGDVFNQGFSQLAGTVKPGLGVPSKLNSKEELVEYLQKIVYTSCIHHTFANFYSFEYTKFAPNQPTVMRGKLPTEEDRGKVTLERILESLPTRKQAATAAATTRILSNYAVDEIYIRETPNWMFTEEKAREVFERFRKNLDDIEEKLVARNKGLKVPYTILLPSKIPAGIAV